MRKLLWIATLAMALSIAGPGAARAGDEGWAALGGFIGGAILSDAFGHHGHHSVHTRVIVSEPRYVREVVYEAPPRYVARRVWHEGYWSSSYDRCGRRIKTWIPGYYSVERVRVAYPRHGDHYRGHHRSYRDDHYRSRRSCRW